MVLSIVCVEIGYHAGQHKKRRVPKQFFTAFPRRFSCKYTYPIDALFGELNIFATIKPVMKAITLMTNGVPLSGIPG